MEEKTEQQRFREMIAQMLNLIHPDLQMGVSDEADYASLYRYVENYVMEKCLRNSAVALPLVAGMLTRNDDDLIIRANDAASREVFFSHCLSVCRMLIDLHIPLSSRDEDIMLASALCHVLPETMRFSSLKYELIQQYRLDPGVYEIVNLLYRNEEGMEEEQRAYYNAIQENRLALMIKLADQGNLVEQLYGISTWSARRYIHETRTYFFPMCIYAKEHHHGIRAPISILMEKMRSLTVVAEILLSRFETQESDLLQEILALQEENAALRGVIGMMEKTKES